jgi:SAM-dependent methyltransferase
MSIQDHYDKLLARHYTWMCGDYDTKVSEFTAFFKNHGIVPNGSGKALDLGCGSGFQSVALAGLGFDVLSIDTSAELLRELRGGAEGKLVTTMHGDMRNTELYAPHAPFEVAVCMGDSLTLLASFEEVESLLKVLHDCLEPGGKLVLGFRDLSLELTGVNRVLPVRSDDEKIMTVFLEYEAEHVNVHDLFYLRENGAWTLHKSAYKKLRVSAERTIASLRQLGFQNVSHEMERGFSTIIAQ